MGKALKADFYRVTISNNISFNEVVNYVNSLTPEDKNLRGVSAPFRLQEVYLNKDIIEGDMIRIRMDQVPVKASLSGDTEFIKLKDNEGIGEETAFLYYIPLKILVLQRNRYALSASAFAWYFNAKGEINNALTLNPVLRADVLQRLTDMTIIRKFDVKIAGIDNSDIFRDQGHGVNEIISLKKEFQSPNVSISLSMGKRR